MIKKNDFDWVPEFTVAVYDFFTKIQRRAEKDFCKYCGNYCVCKSWDLCEINTVKLVARMATASMYQRMTDEEKKLVAEDKKQ